MGKVCWINGQPYSVGLPTGGAHEEDYANQWRDMVNFLGKKCNKQFHWDETLSWCQDKPPFHKSCRVVRGCYSANYWSYNLTETSSPRLGFRPVLAPLNPDTLKPDPSLLQDIPDGEKIALASLYVGKKPVPIFTKKGLCYDGEVDIILGDRDMDKDNWLYTIKYKDLLWADRNILVGISWNDLQKQGYAPLLRAIRGHNSARYWYYGTATRFTPVVGFRPILTPLSADTLKPDLSLLADIPDGQKIALASLYMGENPVDLSNEKGPIYYHHKRWKIALGDRDKDEDNWLYVVKYKNLLWADRNILTNISWEDLQEQGYTD